MDGGRDGRRQRPWRVARPLGAGSLLAVATFLAFAALVASAARDAAAQEHPGRAQVYACRHRVADELLPLAQAVLAGEGEAVVDRRTNTIVLIGPPAAVAEAMALLAKQDRKARTVLVHYEARSVRELEAAGVRIAWRAGSGSASIGSATFPPGSTGIVAGVDAREARGRGRFAGTLRIVEGESGRIVTGQSVPITTRRGWHERTGYVSAESGFDARARVLGDGRVQVDLAPIQSALRRDGSLAYVAGDTTLILSPGETRVLGGIGRTQRESERGLGGASERESADDTVLLLRAEVE